MQSMNFLGLRCVAGVLARSCIIAAKTARKRIGLAAMDGFVRPTDSYAEKLKIWHKPSLKKTAGSPSLSVERKS